MKALVITEPGGPEVLQLRDVPEPQPEAWELRVDVRASALNRADLLQARGMYPAPPGAPKDIPGLEYAGVVDAVGAQVTRFKKGDRVMGLTGGGAFAERLIVHEREVLAMPEGLSFEQAAAIPEAFITAWDALVPQANLRSGEAVLIHAAASGVGTAAVQIVQALGALPIGTARSQQKLDRLHKDLGLPHGVLTKDGPTFADAVKRATLGRGADVVLELVGGDYVPESLNAMAPKGRLVLVGLMAGPSADVPLGLILQKRLTIRGTVLRSRPLEEKIEAAQFAQRHLVPLFASGKLKPIVDEVFPFTDAARAFERMRDNASFGKIVLRW